MAATYTTQPETPASTSPKKKTKKPSKAKDFFCLHAGCDSSFARKSDLQRHERIHTGERPFQCEECDKCFIQASALKVHERTHTGEKPNLCHLCPKAFSDTSSLARHVRAHLGVKPYPCFFDGCDKKFARKQSLTKHIIAVHGRHGSGDRVAGMPIDDEEDDTAHDLDYQNGQNDKSFALDAFAGSHDLPRSPQKQSSSPFTALGPDLEKLDLVRDDSPLTDIDGADTAYFHEGSSDSDSSYSDTVKGSRRSARRKNVAKGSPKRVEARKKSTLSVSSAVKRHIIGTEAPRGRSTTKQGQESAAISEFSTTEDRTVYGTIRRTSPSLPPRPVSPRNSGSAINISPLTQHYYTTIAPSHHPSDPRQHCYSGPAHRPVPVGYRSTGYVPYSSLANQTQGRLLFQSAVHPGYLQPLAAPPAQLQFGRTVYTTSPELGQHGHGYGRGLGITGMSPQDHHVSAVSSSLHAQNRHLLHPDAASHPDLERCGSVNSDHSAVSAPPVMQHDFRMPSTENYQEPGSVPLIPLPATQPTANSIEGPPVPTGIATPWNHVSPDTPSTMMLLSPRSSPVAPNEPIRPAGDDRNVGGFLSDARTTHTSTSDLDRLDGGFHMRPAHALTSVATLYPTPPPSTQIEQAAQFEEPPSYGYHSHTQAQSQGTSYVANTSYLAPSTSGLVATATSSSPEPQRQSQIQAFDQLAERQMAGYKPMSLNNLPDGAPSSGNPYLAAPMMIRSFSSPVLQHTAAADAMGVTAQPAFRSSQQTNSRGEPQYQNAQIAPRPSLFGQGNKLPFPPAPTIRQESVFGSQQYYEDPDDEPFHQQYIRPSALVVAP